MAGIWFALALLSISEVSSLKICSFNIQSFGERKMEKTEVVDVILDVSTSDVVHLLILYIVNHSIQLNPLNRTEMYHAKSVLCVNIVLLVHAVCILQHLYLCLWQDVFKTMHGC